MGNLYKNCPKFGKDIIKKIKGVVFTKHPVLYSMQFKSRRPHLDQSRVVAFWLTARLATYIKETTIMSQYRRSANHYNVPLPRQEPLLFSVYLSNTSPSPVNAYNAHPIALSQLLLLLLIKGAFVSGSDLTQLQRQQAGKEAQRDGGMTALQLVV